MRLRLTCTLALALAVYTLFAVQHAAAHTSRVLRSAQWESMSAFGQAVLVQRFRRNVWQWQHVMGVRLTPGDGNPYRTTPQRRLQLIERWHDRLLSTYQAFLDPPHKQQWQCIQSYETAPPFPGWRTNSGNRYYGGLQMDIDFMRAYGKWLLHRKGTADNWTPLEQMWTAEHALPTRGYHPWPLTAHDCGLI
jgi:hypothetical protein